MNINPAITDFGVSNILNGFIRPTIKPNAWIAAQEDQNPSLTFKWDKQQMINRIILNFDTDFDHPMESVQMGHPETEFLLCEKFRILSEIGK